MAIPELIGVVFSARVIGGKDETSMKRKIVYTNEPIRIGRIIPKESLFGHGGARSGAGRPRSDNEPVTVRLPTKLVARLRREARRSGKSLSQLIAAKLQG